MTKINNRVAGVLLAGGLARRMGGGDKSLKMLGGKTILSRIIDRVAPQVDALVLNANGDADRFQEYGLPVTPDVVPDYAGPLAGILTGLEWAAKYAPQCAWVASFPTDAPFLPEDLVTRMFDAVEKENADLSCASSGGRANPVCGLWPVRLRQELRAAMEEEGIRKVDIWTARYTLVEVAFPTEPVDPFFNTNRIDDLNKAEELLSRLRAGEKG